MSLKRPGRDCRFVLPPYDRTRLRVALAASVSAEMRVPVTILGPAATPFGGASITSLVVLGPPRRKAKPAQGRVGN